MRTNVKRTNRSTFTRAAPSPACWLVCVFSVVAGVGGAHAQDAPAPARKPNILLIVADDLGYADLGYQGSEDIPTPHIDSLAKNGVRCTSGYVSAPVCSPSRAGLLTGRYQQRFGHEFNPPPQEKASSELGLPLTEVTLADRLRAAGYTTGMVGKWHLGNHEKLHPRRRGFDEFFGFLRQHHPYTKTTRLDPILRGTEKVDEREYLTDAFTREAVAFIDRNAKTPFFLYLPYNAVHNPLEAPRKYLDRFADLGDAKRRTYAAMVSALDDGVGAVLTKLRQAGIEDDTLIFFLSDNGGPIKVNASRNDPLAGAKAKLQEGGIRVPFLVQWTGRLPAGKVYEQPVIALDILPTAIAAAGGKLPDDAKVDGVNLLPHLAGQTERPPHEMLFWRFGSQSAVRKGDWKLLTQGSMPAQLFDLAADIGEANDLAARKSDLVKELAAALRQWDGQLAKPLWGGGQEKGRDR